MRRFILSILLGLLTMAGFPKRQPFAKEQEVKGPLQGRTLTTCLDHSKTLVQPADRPHAAVPKTVLIDKDFEASCLLSLERALDILRRLAN